MQNFRPISEEIKNRMSIFKMAVAPHRNTMRARYKDRSEKSTNGVGVVTPLHAVATIAAAVAAAPAVARRCRQVSRQSVGFATS